MAKILVRRGQEESLTTLREQLGRQRQREASRVAANKAVEKCGSGWSDLGGELGPEVDAIRNYIR